MVLTGLSINLAAFYYISTLRNAQRNQKQQLETRQIQIYMQILDRFASEENRLRSIQVQQMEYKDFADFQDKWSMAKNPEAAAKRLHVWTELDGLGQLLNKGLISIEFIPTLTLAIVIIQWEKWARAHIQRKTPDKLCQCFFY